MGEEIIKDQKKVSIFRKELIFEYSKTFFIALLLALLFKSLCFEQFKVPTSSMVPTIMIGDRLIVSKYKYGYSKYSFPFNISFFQGRVFFTKPARGDVVIFKSNDEKINYIKRLIGLPGDTIHLKNGVLYVNGTPLKREKVGYFYQIGQYGENIIFDVYEESIENNKKYHIMQYQKNTKSSDIFDEDNTLQYRVPENHYFFMGDNRNNSADSRFLNGIGYVHEDQLMGRAEMIIWPGDFSFKEFFTKMDLGRLFWRFSAASD